MLPKVMNMAKFRKISVSEDVYDFIKANKGEKSISTYLLNELVKRVSFEAKLNELEKKVKDLEQLAGGRY